MTWFRVRCCTELFGVTLQLHEQGKAERKRAEKNLRGFHITSCGPGQRVQPDRKNAELHPAKLGQKKEDRIR